MTATTVLSFDGERELVTVERAHELLCAYQFDATVHVPSFTHITLRNKSYTLEAAQVIAAFFTQLDQHNAFAHLTSVDFADIIAGRPEDEALQVLSTLCDSLKLIKTLTRIDLSDNALGEKGVRACFGLLLHQEHLQHVYFCNNGISATAAAVIADEVLLFRGADVPTKLVTFHFYNNMSGDAGAIALGRLLSQSPLLRDVRFSATRAQRVGSLALAMSLRHLQHLEKLDLSDNTFSAAGGIAIAAAMRQQPSLMEINLRDAMIEDDGMMAIANALSCVGALNTLDVSGNDLTADSVEQLATALSSLPLLRVLQMEENEMGSRGAKALANAIKTSVPVLEKLTVNVNEISSAGAVALVKAVAKKTTFQSLEVDGNMISSKSIDKIQQWLEKENKTHVLGVLEDNDEVGDEDDEEEEAVVAPPAPVAVAAVDALTAHLQSTLQIATFAFKDTKREVVDAARAIALLTESGIAVDSNVPLRYTSISLRGKSYTDEGAAVMARAFLSRLEAPFLKVVDLADVIAGRPEDEALRVLTAISSALGGHVLDSIDLSDNALGEKGVRACFALLIPQPQLRRLLFCNNGISASAATVIAREIVLQNGFNVLSTLEEFHFYNNMSGHDGALAVSNVLAQCTKLRVFRFASARAGLEASAMLASKIAAHLTALTSLDLSDCSFEGAGVEALAGAVGAQKKMTHLKLRDASLGPEGAVRVLTAIVDNGLGEQLVELDLSGNELADEGMKLIAPLLPRLKALRVLRLDENEITSSGVDVLVLAVVSNAALRELRELSVCGNEITAKGAKAIVERLVQMPHLNKLELDANMISDKGVEWIQQTLAVAGRTSVIGSLADNDGDEESEDED